MYDTSWYNTAPATNGGRQMPLRLFAGLIGLFLLAGGFAAAGVAVVGPRFIDPIVLAAGSVLAIVGGFEVAARSRRWWISLGGHLVVSAGVGGTASLFLASPVGGAVAGVAVLSGIGVTWLTLLAFLRPAAVRAFGAFAIAAGMAAGSAYLLPEIYAGLTGAELSWPVAAGAVAVLGYLDFYWTQALSLTRTADVAADAACAIYLDPLNRAVALLDRMSS